MMSLETLKNNWESLAERDALYAILTDHRRAGGKWNVPEFMATGEAEMETVMDHLAGIGCTPNYAGKALDFGCGVGRVTQALAPRFTSCVGVDISPQMIDKARSLNRYAHCRYLANSGEQLPFADDSFSFIYSNIVLQHVPRRFSTAYLQEFVRVLAPGGILVFGVQDSFAAPDVSSLLVRVRHILRIRSRIRAAAGWGICKCIVCRSTSSAKHLAPPGSWIFSSPTRLRKTLMENSSICGTGLDLVMLANNIASVCKQAEICNTIRP